VCSYITNDFSVDDNKTITMCNLNFDCLIFCETKHCNNVGCYKVGEEWICDECILAMDGLQLQKETDRVDNNIKQQKYRKKK